jgi:hypothetical protein
MCTLVLHYRKNVLPKVLLYDAFLAVICTHTHTLCCYESGIRPRQRKRVPCTVLVIIMNSEYRIHSLEQRQHMALHRRILYAL